MVLLTEHINKTAALLERYVEHHPEQPGADAG